VRRNSPSKERRQWDRLQLAVPVFVRAKDDTGKECLEFATATNVGAGGALVVSRRALPLAAPVLLEIPSAPFGPVAGLPRSNRSMRAKIVWVSHLNSYHLLGLRFSKPLGTDKA
jgi:PilZ domain